ncbi:MAG: MerR family transcriptional regulator [Actinobacteria bacterium]|nr:MerR family transcriptional regulator [Actinomycetota bacterium]
MAKEPRPAVEPTGYSLADLAEATGVTERTIRYYQAEKLIPKPAKQGRERRYDEGHRERIALIVDLRDRGLNLSTIRDLVDNDDPTHTVASWLGIDAALSAPWSDDRPRTVTLEELRGLVDDPTPGLLAELHDTGYTRANPDGTWTVPSPALLQLALGLRGSDIDLVTTAKIRDLLRRRVSKAVDEVVDHLVERWRSDFAGEGGVDRFATTLGTLRPVAGEMTGLILAQEVERALGELVASRAVDLARSESTE